MTSDPRLLLAAAHKAVRELVADCAADASAIADLEEEWPHIMAGVGLPSSGSAERAIPALRVVEAVVTACVVRHRLGQVSGAGDVTGRANAAGELLEAIEARLAV